MMFRHYVDVHGSIYIYVEWSALCGEYIVRVATEWYVCPSVDHGGQAL